MPEAERKARATPGAPTSAATWWMGCRVGVNPCSACATTCRAAPPPAGTFAEPVLYYPALSRGPERKEAPPW